MLHMGTRIAAADRTRERVKTAQSDDAVARSRGKNAVADSEDAQ